MTVLIAGAGIRVLPTARQPADAFDAVLSGAGIAVAKIPAPRPGSERLCRVLIAGLRHLRTVPEQPRHCNRHRPHRARYLRPPDGDGITLAAITGLITAGIWRRTVLGGLISEYERAA